MAGEIHSMGLFLPSALRETRQFAQSLLGSLNQLHRLGIAHRDVKPANMLIKDSSAGVLEVVLSDAGMAVFPTSQHRPDPSPGSSPVTPQMTKLGSGRAVAVHRAAGGQDLRRSPPANLEPLIPIHINPGELTTIFSTNFRVRDNAGTHVFTGPEFPFSRTKGTMMSTEFLPGDMWAVGWILLQILSGYKVEWIQDPDLKRKMANCSPSQFWTEYLRLPGQPSADPAALCAIDLVRGLLRADPALRLSCSAALAHPFLSQA
jgi:serine/threonine protein kinase